jgi:hypothetical protein
MGVSGRCIGEVLGVGLGLGGDELTGLFVVMVTAFLPPLHTVLAVTLSPLVVWRWGWWVLTGSDVLADAHAVR